MMDSDNFVNDNILRDISLNALLYNLNENNDNNKVVEDIKEHYYSFLYNFFENPNDVRFFDFKIKVKNDKFIIKPNNLISGLWFNGIFPHDVDDIVKSDRYDVNDGYYMFNVKQKKIKFIENE